MKILHIVPTYVPAYRYGGPIESVHALNKALVAAGDEVTVLTTNVNGAEDLDVPLGRAVDMDGVKIFYFPTRFPRAWYYSPAMRDAAEKMAPDFDVIHETSVFLYQSFLARRLAEKFKKPFVISPRGSLMKGTLGLKGTLKKKIYISLIERKNLLVSSFLHFTAEPEREEYDASGLPKKKSVVVPNIIEPNVSAPLLIFREKFGIAPGKKVILSLGRLNWKKGFDTLVPAFAAVSRDFPEALLIIAGGDDGYKKDIERMVLSHHLSGAVIFTGPLKGEEKEAAYRESNVFVLPSYSENFGMSAGEAMRAGLPVVVTPGVAIALDIEKAGAGKIAEKNPDAVAGALLSLLRNPEEAKEMGKRGRELVKSRFSPRAVAEAMRSAYNNSVTLP